MYSSYHPRHQLLWLVFVVKVTLEWKLDTSTYNHHGPDIQEFFSEFRKLRGQAIHLYLPNCGPGFESLTHMLFPIYKIDWHHISCVKRTEMGGKEPGLARIWKKLSDLWQVCLSSLVYLSHFRLTRTFWSSLQSVIVKSTSISIFSR